MRRRSAGTAPSLAASAALALLAGCNIPDPRGDTFVCVTSRDCLSSHRCGPANTCVPAECKQHSDCAPGLSCADRACRGACNVPNDCDVERETCTAGLCLPRASCETVAQCTAPEVCETSDGATCTQELCSYPAAARASPCAPPLAQPTSDGAFVCDGERRCLPRDLLGGIVATIAIGPQQAPLTRVVPIIFTVTFDRPVSAPVPYVSGGTVSYVRQLGSAANVGWSVTAVDDTVWLLRADRAGDGTIIPHLNAGFARDADGNTTLDTSLTGPGVTLDATAPTVTITQATAQADPTGDVPITFVVAFSEAIDASTFVANDIGQRGTASTVSWALSSQDGATWGLQAIGATAGTIEPGLAAGKVTDLAGNPNAPSTSTDGAVTYAPLGPTVVVEQGTSQADPTKVYPVAFTVTFSRAIDPGSFTVDDITQSGTATGVTWSLSTSNNLLYALTATAGSSGTVSPTIGAGRVFDTVASGNSASASTDNTVTVDTTSPTVTIEQATTQADPTNTLPAAFRVVFSEPINQATFTVSDLTQSGTSTGVAWNLATSDGVTFVLTATAANQGTLRPTLPAGRVTDLAGNANAASTSTDNSVTVDTTGPTVTVNQAPAQSDPASALPVSFRVVFSEPIAPASFTATDVDETGTAAGVVWSLSTSDSVTWALLATASSEGTLIPRIAAGRVTDVAGNANNASTSTDGTVTYDVPEVSVTVNQRATGQNDPTNSLPVRFTVTFATAMNPATFTTSDIVQSGTASSITWSLSTTDDITWTLSATGAGPGTIVPSLPAGRVQTMEGIFNLASTSVDNSVTYDNVGPSVTINQSAGQLDPTSVSPVSFTAVFSEAIDPSTFTSADLSQGGTAGVVSWSVSTSDNVTWTVLASVSTLGTVVASLGAAQVTDRAGNSNLASTSTDNSVTYDDAPPTATITGLPDPEEGTELIRVLFSENVTGVELADFLPGGGGLLSNFVALTPVLYTMKLRLTEPSSPSVTLAAGTVTDLSGGTNPPASRSCSLLELPDPVIDLRPDAYDGSGVWKNVFAPASYALLVGSGPASAPDHVAATATMPAHFLFDGDDVLVAQELNDAFLDSLHQDNASFTISVELDMPTYGTASLFTTGSWNNQPGVALHVDDATLRFQVGDGVPLSGTCAGSGALCSTAVPHGSPASATVFAISMDEPGGTYRLRAGANGTNGSGASYVTPASGATPYDRYAVGGTIETGLSSPFFPAGTRLYRVRVWNQALGDAELAALTRVGGYCSAVLTATRECLFVEACVGGAARVSVVGNTLTVTEENEALGSMAGCSGMTSRLNGSASLAGSGVIAVNGVQRSSTLAFAVDVPTMTRFAVLEQRGPVSLYDANTVRFDDTGHAGPAHYTAQLCWH